MVVTFTYRIKSGEIRKKSFIRDTVAEAKKFFAWRYGHPVILIRARQA